MRLLSVLQLEAEAPVVRVEAADVRKHARKAGELDARRLGKRLLRDQPRREQLPCECGEVVERAEEIGGRRAAELGRDPERLEHRLAQVRVERHRRVRGNRLGRELDAGFE